MQMCSINLVLKIIRTQFVQKPIKIFKRHLNIDLIINLYIPKIND